MGLGPLKDSMLLAHTQDHLTDQHGQGTGRIFRIDRAH